MLLKPKRQASGDGDADRFLNVGDDGQDCVYAVPICLFCAMLVWDAIGAARADDNASFYERLGLQLAAKIHASGLWKCSLRFQSVCY